MSLADGGPLLARAEAGVVSALEVAPLGPEVLQQLVDASPAVFCRPAAPGSRWLSVGRVQRQGRDGLGPARWLVVDEQGVPTVVVVPDGPSVEAGTAGRLLVEAAAACDDVWRDTFAASCARLGVTSDLVTRRALGIDEQRLWDAVADHLEAGVVRALAVVGAVPVRAERLDALSRLVGGSQIGFVIVDGALETGGRAVLRMRTALSRDEPAAVAAAHEWGDLPGTGRRDGTQEITRQVAHHLNNILTPIVGYSDLLSEQLGVDHPGRPDLEEVRVAAQRAASLGDRLLCAGRAAVLRLEQVRLAEVMADVAASSELDASQLDAEDGALDAVVVVDRSRLVDAVHELLDNALSSSPTPGDVRIVVRADPSRSRVSIAVVDGGVGMRPDVLTRALEPFFTTRQHEARAGVGLPAVAGVVEQMGGALSVESTVGHGTTATIELVAAALPTATPGAAGRGYGRRGPA